MEIVRGLAAGELDLAAAGGKVAVGVIGAAEERFFQPGRADFLQHRNARRGGLDILAEDLAGVDQQGAVAPKPFARRLELVAIVGQTAAAERSPAAFDGAKPLVARRRQPASVWPGVSPKSCEA